MSSWTELFDTRDRANRLVVYEAMDKLCWSVNDFIHRSPDTEAALISLQRRLSELDSGNGSDHELALAELPALAESVVERAFLSHFTPPYSQQRSRATAVHIAASRAAGSLVLDEGRAAYYGVYDRARDAFSDVLNGPTEKLARLLALHAALSYMEQNGLTTSELRGQHEDEIKRVMRRAALGTFTRVERLVQMDCRIARRWALAEIRPAPSVCFHIGNRGSPRAPREGRSRRVRRCARAPARGDPDPAEHEQAFAGSSLLRKVAMSVELRVLVRASVEVPIGRCFDESRGGRPLGLAGMIAAGLIVAYLSFRFGWVG
jgi:hypothetical protein